MSGGTPGNVGGGRAAAFVVEVLNTKPNAVLGMATGSTPLGLCPRARGLR